MNIDIVDRSGNESGLGYLAGIRKILKGETLVSDLREMVARIGHQLGPEGRIRRLRIFGHGSRGIQVVGGGQQPSSSLEWLQLETPEPRRIRTRRGGIIHAYNYQHQPLQNEHLLLGLSGRFEPGGWVELRGCLVAAGDGIYLLRRLVHIWNVRVAGSTDYQRPGGGWEGEVLWVGPNGYFSRRRY